MPRKPAPLPAAPTALAVGLLDSIDRDDLHSAMAASGDPRFAQLADAMLDPRYSRTAFIDILRKLKIPLTDLVDMWRKYNLNIGLAGMYARVPQVLADTARDATTADRTCPACLGDRSVPDTRKGREGQMVICGICSGTGTIRVIGDLASRKLVFETAELTGRPSTSINVGSNNTTTVATSISVAFRDTIEQANRALDLGPVQRLDLIEAVDESQIVDVIAVEGEK